MVLLQGPRLMAWTTKSLIRVITGCPKVVGLFLALLSRSTIKSNKSSLGSKDEFFLAFYSHARQWKRRSLEKGKCWQLGSCLHFYYWNNAVFPCATSRNISLNIGGQGFLKLLNCSFKTCVWCWQHRVFSNPRKLGLDLTWNDFIYYGKTWNSKKYPFTNVKIGCHLKWKTSTSNVHLLAFVRWNR